MALTNVVAGNQLFATDINGIINLVNTHDSSITTLQSQMSTANSNISTLQSQMTSVQHQLQQPSGGHEYGKWILEAGIWEANAYAAQYMESLSKGTTPSGVSIDTADISAVGFNAPAADQISQYGFRVKASATGATSDSRVGGNYTISY